MATASNSKCPNPRNEGYPVVVHIQGHTKNGLKNEKQFAFQMGQKYNAEEFKIHQFWEVQKWKWKRATQKLAKLNVVEASLRFEPSGDH